ncbi:MAG: hypothetical protein ACYS74_03535 [Planctomycetota bacterium]
MPRFKTTVNFANEPELGNKGMVFTVKMDERIHGHLMVGKASLFWFEKNAKKKARRMAWSDLAKVFEKRTEVQVARP